MKSLEVERARVSFAERIRDIAGLRSPLLVRALATVPRERFVGPGPWKILTRAELGRGYRTTPDDDPRHLYANVLVALDAARQLNNGEPASLCRWLDDLDLVPGERFLHVGCGVGYYTAIAAEVVSRAGSVVGVEVDPRLAERARENLSAYDNAVILTGDASELEGELFDAIFVNAGVTDLLPRWLDQIGTGGRLLAPLTVALPDAELGAGHMLRVVAHLGDYSARFVSPVGIFHCAGARSDEGNDLLTEAYRRGGEGDVASVRRDSHPADRDCWLHAPRFCLSRRAVRKPSPPAPDRAPP